MKHLVIAIFIILSSVNIVFGQDVTTGYANINGTTLYYEIAGEGNPLVLIHGNGGDLRHWDDQFLPLAKFFTVIRYDVRGYGKSGMPNPDKEYSNHNDLKSLLQYLKVKKAHICGLSMGSGIAVNFALAFPEMCSSVISAGPWVNGYDSPAAQVLHSIMKEITPVLKEKGVKAAVDFWLEGNEVFKNAFPNPKTVEKMKTVGYDYSFWGFLNKPKIKPFHPTAAERLQEIKAPVLIISGENDLQACKEIADFMAKNIFDSKKIILKNAGHCVNIDRPDVFNTEIVQFTTKNKW